MAVRQQLRQSTCQPSKSKLPSQEVLQLRLHHFSAVHITSFMATLSTYNNSTQENILKELTGQELSKILKSLGKPLLLRKKCKQVGLLLEVLKSG